MNIGNRLMNLRKYNHYEREELSRLSGVSLNTLIAIEENKIKPSKEDAKDLSHFLGVDASYIKGEEEKYYIAYLHVTYRYEDNILTKTDAWEKAFVKSGIDFYNYDIAVNEEGYLVFLDNNQNSVYQIKDMQDIMLTLTSNVKKGLINIEDM